MQSELARINHKHISWVEGFACQIAGGCLKLVGSELKLRPLQSIPTLSVLIHRWLVIDWHLIGKWTQIAYSFCPTFGEDHVWVDVGFAPVAPERAFMVIVNHWDVWDPIDGLLLGHLCQGLD